MKNRKKQFYKNKNRNTKWTEEPVGRYIDFADKYEEGSSSYNMFDSARQGSFEKEKKKKRKQKIINRAVAVVLSMVLIATGYTAMDLYMARKARPAELYGTYESNEQGAMSDIAFDISACKVDSISLDSSIMLSSVIHDMENIGCFAVAFDIKRSDGTIAYKSQLALVDTFSAVTSPASQIEKSVRELLDNDILPIARISCYMDNVVVNKAGNMAIWADDKHLYTDKDGNTFLNPENKDVYKYIKDIISECYGYGITVFVLNNCNLPKDISDVYNDGFDVIAEKLNKDFDGNIKLLEEIDVSVNARDKESGKVTSSAIKKEIEALKKPDKNKIYYITTNASGKKVYERLQKSEISRYILDE